MSDTYILTQWNDRQGREWCHEWRIVKGGYVVGPEHVSERVVWRRAMTLDEYKTDDVRNHFWPADMRAEYERLLGRPEFLSPTDPGESASGLVEMLAEPDECGFDQPCAYGYRVEQHAVYCHNDGWLYAPRKCRRDRADYRHEDCPGFREPERKP